MYADRRPTKSLVRGTVCCSAITVATFGGAAAGGALPEPHPARAIMTRQGNNNARDAGFIIFLREKRRPSGRRGIVTRIARHASHASHFSVFSKLLWGDYLIYCMDVQSSISHRSGPAPAGEGQARRVAVRFGARGQHGVQLLQRAVGQSIRARTALFVW